MFRKARRVHMVGIGGTGMCGIAEVLINLGYPVSGSDLATNVAKEWDLCAPHALMLEAGGLLTNLCGEHLVYNKPEIVGCRGLIGSNGLAHERIVEKLAPLLDESNG